MARVRTPGEVGALIRAARSARGWNQQQLASAAGVSRRFVSALEGGGHANAELWRVLAVVDAVGVVLTGTATATATPTPDRSTRVAADSAAVADGAEDQAPGPEQPAMPDMELPGGFDLNAHLSSFRGAGPPA